MKPNNRRQFLKGTVAASASALAAPYIGWKTAAKGATPLTTVNIISFGGGGRAGADLKGFAGVPKTKIIAMCDLDMRRAAGSMQLAPDAKFYDDWREMLDESGADADAAGCGTPDHMHAPQMMSAMQLGLHVYGQKPLTRTLHEARALRKKAEADKLVTQMGTQVASSSGNQTAVKWLRERVVGDIVSVHSMNPKSWGSMSPLPDRKDEIPRGFDWDKWIGVCKMRPYLNGEYHPGNWRKRLDFGTGTLGDMGCHIYHPWVQGLNALTPTSVISHGPGPVDKDSWPLDGKMEYTFAATEFSGTSPFPFTWYDGKQLPSDEVAASVGGRANVPKSGSVVIGKTGALVVPHGGAGMPILYREGKLSEENQTLEKVENGNHFANWVEAILAGGSGEAPISNFSYSGPMTENVLLGTVAQRLPGEKLEWDAATGKFTNNKAANDLRHDNYRKGWEVKGI
jgi:predicted dehydrogenase